jgi:hypothetical protein
MALPEKPRISDFPTPVTIQGNIKIAAQDPNNPNLAEQNVGPTIDQLRAYIISGVPTSPGEWITQPTITITNNGNGTVTITVSAGSANFPSGIVDYLQTTYTKTLPAAGLNREDAVSAAENGTYAYSEGTAGTSTSQPPIPAGALLVNYLTLNNSGGTVTTPESASTPPSYASADFDI